MRINETASNQELIFEKYANERWLQYIKEEPCDETKRRIKELLEIFAENPLAPGREVEYPDDTTPENLRRSDISIAESRKMVMYKPKYKDVDCDKVVLYVHGGGFVRGNEKWCRACGIHLANLLKLPTYCCTYRYAPEYKYPCGLDDVEKAWNYLVEELNISPEKIILVGESAGGNFAMALIVRLIAKAKELPGQMLMISPCIDMKFRGLSYNVNTAIDPEFKGINPKKMFEVYAEPLQLELPEVSPIYGELEKFPKTMFYADDCEIFVSDSLQAAQRMADAGIPVCCYISHNLLHASVLEMPEMPESQRFFEEAKNFCGLNKL